MSQDRDKGNLIIYQYVHDWNALPRIIDLLKSWPLLQERVQTVDGIFKCMDINKYGVVFLKGPLLTEFTRLLSRSNVGMEWMINVSKRADLTKLSPRQVCASIQTFIKGLGKPSKISIDAEPLIAWKGDHKTSVIYNIIDFHIDLCSVVNGELGLPVSMYISPSPLALCTLELLEPLFEKLRRNPGNVVYIPAYTHPDPCLEKDLVKSAERLDAADIPYRFIISTRYNKLQGRLNFLKSIEPSCIKLQGYVLYQEEARHLTEAERANINHIADMQKIVDTLLI